MAEDRAKEALLRLKTQQPKSYFFKDYSEIVEGKPTKRVEPQKSEEELLREAATAQQRIERVMHQIDDAARGGSGGSGYLNYYWTIKDLEKKFLEEVKALDIIDKEYLKPQFVARVTLRKEKILERQRLEQERMQRTRR